jgi:NAD(P)-dependent dehydrogenase (short-subunit alcohol dehydrogenase family)
MREFEGKMAIVTGGAQGMGRQYVCLLAEAGANVVLATSTGKRLSARQKSWGSATVCWW